MKLRWLFLLLPALVWATAPASAEELGAFFTNVNAYIFTNAPNQGKKFLIRRRQTFTVTDVTMDGQERKWLQLVYPKATQPVSGEGWTPLAPHEIMSAGPQQMEIYSNILENPIGTIGSISVPATDLKLLNITQHSTRFPQVTWQKVSYKTQKPTHPWVRATAGIYRPGKSREFLSQAYSDMVSRALNQKKLNRLLTGVVRVGDTTLEVEWALGKPLRVVDEIIASAKRTVWHYPTLVVQFENQVVGQIN